MGRAIVIFHLALGVCLIAALGYLLTQRESPVAGESGTLGVERVAAGSEAPPQRVPIRDPEAPPLTFTRHDGKRVDSDDFLGSHLLVFFGFTHCPDVCPATLARATSVLEVLGERGERVVPIFISFDPERDTPEVLARYLSNFHPRLVGLTGSAEEIARAASAYGVYYEKVAAQDGDPSRYAMDHTTRSYLVGPDGNGIGSFAHSTPNDRMAAAIDTVLARAPRVFVESPWSRSTGGMAHAGVVYLTLRNEGEEPDRLLSVRTPAAGDASIHETRMQGDRMSMHHLDALDLPTQSLVALEPGGLHIMLMELAAPLEAGKTFPLHLGFERAGQIAIEVQIEAADAMGPTASGG